MGASCGALDWGAKGFCFFTTSRVIGADADDNTGVETDLSSPPLGDTDSDLLVGDSLSATIFALSLLIGLSAGTCPGFVVANNAFLEAFAAVGRGEGGLKYVSSTRTTPFCPTAAMDPKVGVASFEEGDRLATLALIALSEEVARGVAGAGSIRI